MAVPLALVLKGYGVAYLRPKIWARMLTEPEGQLKQQNAAGQAGPKRWRKSPRAREDRFIPLVTPTSQIVGTRAVLNVRTRRALQNYCQRNGGHFLKGEYGHTSVPVNAALQARVLKGRAPVTCRPADLLKPELAESGKGRQWRRAGEGLLWRETPSTTCSPRRCSRRLALNSLENRHNPAAFGAGTAGGSRAAWWQKVEKPAARYLHREAEGKVR